MQNIRQITIKETREQLAQIIEEVSIGKRSYLITKFNKPKAMLVPVESIKKNPKGKGLESSFGIWSSRKDMLDSAKWVREVREKLTSRYDKISS